jgi:hypothetical protein
MNPDTSPEELVGKKGWASTWILFPLAIPRVLGVFFIEPISLRLCSIDEKLALSLAKAIDHPSMQSFPY